MLNQILIGTGLLVITILIHAVGMSAALRWLMFARLRQFHLARFWVRSLAVAAMVVILFAAILLEAAVWASVYLGLNAISEFEEALYFSMVTYTTLGFGDVVLEGRWRLLSSFEAANGVIIFAWTTALMVVALRRFSRLVRMIKAED